MKLLVGERAKHLVYLRVRLRVHVMDEYGSDYSAYRPCCLAQSLREEITLNEPAFKRTPS